LNLNLKRIKEAKFVQFEPTINSTFYNMSNLTPIFL